MAFWLDSNSDSAEEWSCTLWFSEILCSFFFLNGLPFDMLLDISLDETFVCKCCALQQRHFIGFCSRVHTNHLIKSFAYKLKKTKTTKKSTTWIWREVLFFVVYLIPLIVFLYNYYPRLCCYCIYIYKQQRVIRRNLKLTKLLRLACAEL